MTSFPPKPKELETGRLSHLGGCFSDNPGCTWAAKLLMLLALNISAALSEAGWACAVSAVAVSVVDCKVEMPILPSKEAVAT